MNGSNPLILITSKILAFGAILVYVLISVFLTVRQMGVLYHDSERCSAAMKDSAIPSHFTVQTVYKLKGIHNQTQITL